MRQKTRGRPHRGCRLCCRCAQKEMCRFVVTARGEKPLKYFPSRGVWPECRRAASRNSLPRCCEAAGALGYPDAASTDCDDGVANFLNPTPADETSSCKSL